MSPVPPPTGLCAACAHQQLVPNTRGSVFSKCGRSATDPAFPRYPRLPVLDCAGFEPTTDKPAGSSSYRAADPGGA